MEKKIRTRVIIIAVAMVACILGIICYPRNDQETFGFPTNWQRLKENVRNRIRLGLDLTGGTHLVLQVQVNDAVNVTVDLAQERLRDELRARNIPATVEKKTENGRSYLLITNVPQEKSGDLQTLASEQFPDWELARRAGDPNARELSLKTSAAANIRNQALEQSKTTIENRINQLGVTEPTIADYGQGDYELVVQLPDVDDPTRVKDIIQSTAMLTLKIVRDGPFPTREAALASHGGILPPDSELLPGRRESGSDTATAEAWYVVDRIAAVTGRDLRDAQPRPDENGRPSVNFSLTRDGAARFGRVTGANIGKQLAIVLDNRVVSAPVIQGQISDNGRITGSFTPQQAADLALVLRSGALPASIKYEQETTVGPSLGADSIRHGVIASIVGLLAVMAFMLFYYRGAGINANVALILNLIILVAVLAYFGAVVTLPGIAGVILTVGMGVDSNVLIFERIREELRLGKTVGAAVAGGFDHAFLTIIDTHVTTIVSALILFTFGTGPIRGFAVTLTIGLLANLFTSVFVSRVIFEYVLSRREKGEALSI
ncbi:MAG: protein translocase subunit SecD [Acidobacteriia bacterium]|nr:protein translocase subunit SecD [Terriglobia bacterium]